MPTEFEKWEPIHTLCQDPVQKNGETLENIKKPEKTTRFRITADDRERKCEVVSLLSEAENIDLTVQRLSLGDYTIDGLLIVERKTLKDFAVSIVDGRLFKQMIRLANSSIRSALILEGTATDVADAGVAREAMQGALIMASLILGIPVLRSKSPRETARLIVYIAGQIAAVARGGVHRRGYRPKTRHKRQLYILQGLPGIGPEKAERLLDRFGSVESVMHAGAGELESVEGIGKKTAEKIRWAVGESASLHV